MIVPGGSDAGLFRIQGVGQTQIPSPRREGQPQLTAACGVFPVFVNAKSRQKALLSALQIFVLRHAQDVIAAVNMDNFAGGAKAIVGGEPDGGAANGRQSSV